MRCPRCRIALVVGRAGTLVVHGCARCAGVWIDKGALTCVVDGLSDEALAAFAKHSANPRAHIDESIGQLACPVCADVLERKQVAFADLELDVCEQHGTWFDRGEVECLSRALKPEPVEAPVARPSPPPVHVEGEGDSAYLRAFRGLMKDMHRVQMESIARTEAIFRERERRRRWDH